MKTCSFKYFKRKLLSILTVMSIGFMFAFSPSDIIVMDEICNNGVDDDEDGLIDLNDPECDCPTIEPESLIPNPSFENSECCPSMQSQFSCLSDWSQASFATTDFINTCGWLGWDGPDDVFPPPQPFPDGEGIIGFRDGTISPPIPPNLIETIEGNWKEYAGICLSEPLKIDSLYRIQFYIGFINPFISPPIDVSFFGTTDCLNLPFGGNNPDELIGCPTNTPDWVELGSVNVSGGDGNTWLLRSIDIVTTTEITAIAIGPDCRTNVQSQNLYYFLDNLILDESSAFELDITPVSHPCEEDFSLEVENYPGVLYQWYKNGIALVGETEAQLSQVYGEGNYQVRTEDGTSCKLSGIYSFARPIIKNTISASICEGESFFFNNQELTHSGIYIDTLVSSKECDSIVTLDLDVQGVVIDTMSALLFEGTVFKIGRYSFERPGEYLITLTSDIYCKVLTLLQLEYYDFFIPDVFSPNNDGVNDTFTILAESGLIQKVDLTIFDRWGGIVYQGPEWAGRYKVDFVNPGVYVYVAEIILNNSDSHVLSGSVTVVH